MSLKKDIIEAEFRTTGANKLQHEIGATQGEIKKLNNENDRLRISKTKLEAQGKKNTKAWKDLTAQIKKNNEAVRNEKIKLDELNSKLKITEMSSKQLLQRKRDLTRELNNTSKALNRQKWNQLNSDLKKVDAQYNKVRVGGKGVNTVMSKMGALLPIVGIAAMVAAVKNLGTELFDLAKTMKSEAIRASVVFGDQLGKVEKAAESLAKKMGLTNREFVANAASTADLLIPLGFTREAAADMSIELQSLTGALDEWTGGSVGAKEVSNILTKAMLGENEQLKQLGIAIRKDTDEFRDLVTQKIEVTGATKVQAEAMATLELIQKKSADAQTAYTEGGNELLRTQKKLGVAVKNLKEGFIGLFEVPIEKSLRNQQHEANLLAIRLGDSNLATEERIALLKELGGIAPSIIRGLEAENLNYENLKKNLRAYNDEMANKIVIASLDKEEEKVLARKVRAETNLQEAQRKLAETISWYDNVYSKSIGTSEGSLLEKVIRIQEQVGDMAVAGYIKSYNRAIKKVEEATTTGESFEKRKGNLLRILGIDPDQTPEQTSKGISDYIEEVTDAATETAVEKQTETKEKLMNSLLAQAKVLYENELSLLKEHLSNKNISQQEYEDEMIALKIAYLEIEKEIRVQAGVDVIALEEHILELEIKIMQKKAAEQDKIREEQKKKDEKDGEERAVNNQTQQTETVDQHKQSLDEMVKAYNDNVRAFSDFGAEMGGVLGEALGSGEADMQDMLRKTLLTALKFVRDFVRAKITMMSLASADSIATFGISGIAKAAALNLIVEGAYQGVKHLLSSKIDSGFVAGGPTGLGGKYEPAGIVHHREYVIPEEGLFNPYLRPFINMIESARQAGTLRSLGARAPLTGFAEGGPTSEPMMIQPSVVDPAMANLLRANIEFLQMLRDQGVYAYIGDRQVRDIRDRTRIIEGIENSVSK